LTLTAGSSDRDEAFKQSLQNLGWLDGQNIKFEYRWLAGKTERIPAVVDELVRAKVDVIFSTSTTVTNALRKATVTIPIVMPAGAEPLETGFAASLARPGANITGVSSMSQELEGKRLELLHETIPRLTRVGYLSLGRSRFIKDAKEVGQKLGLKVQQLVINGIEELDDAFSAILKDLPDALCISPLLISNLGMAGRIAEFSIRQRLPTISDAKEFVDAGGLLSYGSNRLELWRRSAWYVDKILRGAHPGDLPIEQPTKFDFIINLKTAKQIGLIIPPNVLARADRVIK
jgi:putative ABC transport system substrate-binding protein